MSSSAHALYAFYVLYKQIGMIQNSFLRQLRLKRIRNKISKIRLVNSNYKNKDNSITFLMLRSLLKGQNRRFLIFFSNGKVFRRTFNANIFLPLFF